ncbi:MAG: amidohydrolase [Patescibacteria group bacterium]|nr:amidohydrolase [Patescibacteria group bacterium]
MNRRNFITSTLAAGLTGVLPASSEIKTQAGSQSKIAGIVDCHIHFWAKDKKQYPYDPNPQYAPEQSTTPEEWESDRQGAGIGIAIHVNGAPYKLNHNYFFHTLKIAPKTLRGVVLVNPNVPEGLAQFEKMVEQNNHVVGARLQTQWAWDISWDSPHLGSFWKRLGEIDKVVQVNVQSEFAWNLERMIKKFPDTRVVIDHLGLERSKSIPGYSKLLELGKYPNVYMKLSNFSSLSGQEPPCENLVPLINEILEHFTPKRVVWGSCLQQGGLGSEHYIKLINEVLYFLKSLSIDEQKQVLAEAPKRLFRI